MTHRRETHWSAVLPAAGEALAEGLLNSLTSKTLAANETYAWGCAQGSNWNPPFMTSPPRSKSSIDPSPAFWAEISPCEHALQLYQDDSAFLDALEAFVALGLEAGEAVIVIATQAHRDALEHRLSSRGVSFNIARATDSYIALDADETLSRFMVNDWPDADLFSQTIAGLLTRARANGRKVRAFGEMVALMWERGLNGATVRLEFLWDQLCKSEGFALLCAYPKSGFTQDASAWMNEIRAAHSLVVDRDIETGMVRLEEQAVHLR